MQRWDRSASTSWWESWMRRPARGTTRRRSAPATTYRAASTTERPPSTASLTSSTSRSTSRARPRSAAPSRRTGRRSRSPASWSFSAALRRQRGPGDRGRLLVVPLGGGKRLVDLVERILVREDPRPWPASLRAHEEVERARDHPRVVLDHTDDLLRAPDQQ